MLQKVVEYLRGAFPHYSWVGVYLVDGDVLRLSAWDGKQPTVHVAIPVGRGICGLAARTGQTVLVGDVSKDNRYLACFTTTKSEIVVPIKRGSEVVGEIDIDGDQLNAYNESDKEFLESVAELLSGVISG